MSTDGRIRVRGEGLLLAGGNNIGLNGGQSVFATLICSATAPFTQFSTPSTSVRSKRTAISGSTTLNPLPPADCASPVLLIRNTGRAWFAAGILKRSGGD